MKRVAAALALSFWGSVAAGQVFDRTADTATGSLRLGEIRELQKPLIFSTRIPDTPEGILAAEIYSQRGEEVKFRVLADPTSGLIIGTIRDDIEITVTKVVRDRGQTHFIVSAMRDGQFVALRAEDIVVVDRRYRDQCFSWSRLTDDQDTQVLVQVFVDVSGSMREAMPDVRASASEFLHRLPANAICRMRVFGDNQIGIREGAVSRSIEPGQAAGAAPVYPVQSCDAFADPDFLNQHLQPTRSGTKIPEAMLEGYLDLIATHNRLQVSYNSDPLSLVMVITDGLDGRTGRVFNDMLGARDQAIQEYGTYTFVNWLGSFDQGAPVARIADGQLIGRVGNRPFAEDFFRNTLQLVDNQHVLRPRSCS